MGLFGFLKKKRDQSTSPSKNATLTENAMQLGKPVSKEPPSNTDSCDEKRNDSEIDAAVTSLRNKIIAEITRDPAMKYQLASLIGKDAEKCFPNGPYSWDGAWFYINLRTGKLWAEASTYPNQFGAYEDQFYSLSASEFNRIAKQFHMRKELQAFRSDEDWAKLFDDSLKSAVSSACAVIEKRDEEREKEKIKKNAVKIPTEYAKQTPDMCLSEITITTDQRFASRSIKVSNDSGNYQIVYERFGYMPQQIEKYPRVLSAAEAVWLEKQVRDTIKNPDDSTWQSLPGGDTMDIVIMRNKDSNVSLREVKPLSKYSKLQNELEKLAQYGSTLV